MSVCLLVELSWTHPPNPWSPLPISSPFSIFLSSFYFASFLHGSGGERRLVVVLYYCPKLYALSIDVDEPSERSGLRMIYHLFDAGHPFAEDLSLLVRNLFLTRMDLRRKKE